MRHKGLEKFFGKGMEIAEDAVLFNFVDDDFPTKEIATMIDPLESETLWLNVTNIALGLVTLVCLVAVTGIAVRELTMRARKRVTVPVHADSHTFVLSDLGITMADGGEKIDEGPRHQPKDEPSNIFRSNN